MQAGDSDAAVQARHFACMQHLLAQAQEVIHQQHTVMQVALQQQASQVCSTGTG
jgi:hypothetical protein